MLKNNQILPKEGLYFLSLGGIGEIGGNCYLYGVDNKWIMIDLGLSFADERYPGVDLLLPQIDFLNKIESNLVGVIISHGHEDHAGALAFYAEKIKCPIYASGFTASIIKNRLKEFGKSSLVEINIIKTSEELKLKNFDLNFINTTHSIPEPFSILIKTKYGNLLHTADWKIDSNPEVGHDFDKNAFKSLGNQGVLALIGDSTNANSNDRQISESDVKKELIKIFSRYNDRIVITCFSSNIARIQSIAIAAKKNNRKVALVGRSILRNIEAAKENGYLSDIDNFITEEEASYIPKEQVVIITTGSQGEKRSALYRIAYNSHQNISLDIGDVVIFSSKDIPGNEKSISNLQNLLIRQKIDIITCDNELVHASGHCYADEIKKMYQWIRPHISIPVHGEPKHLLAHSILAQSVQVPITKILDNGLCYKIAPGKPEISTKIETGKLIVEGKKYYNANDEFIKNRRKISFEGLVVLSIIINSDLSLQKDIMISINGLPSKNSEKAIIYFKENFYDLYIRLSEDKKLSNEYIEKISIKVLRKYFKLEYGKKPEINIHVIRL
ncbi:MAG: Ribonuclease J1 [Alphaproteobacteria bacterium MarineAlpha5_Bin9]|nr:MAG: Ribonuclease J1 [Alphaproteobacteria bacterium MarineAlpha5_Bin9]|tara:strand:+ start:6655 stop:8322 length:1668 start_codon:yes stop_codon:yes gene_type:complete